MKIGNQLNLKWESSQQILLDETKMNCGHCDNCGILPIFIIIQSPQTPPQPAHGPISDISHPS